MTDIEWGYNCLTAGIHHGRPEKVWNMTLVQATYMFTADQLQQLVIARIYNDAMQFVEHGDFSKEWALKVRELASIEILPVFDRKVAEIIDYYKSPGFKADIDFALDRVKADKLNPHYDPFHGHDTINMLCRIVGTTASRSA